MIEKYHYPQLTDSVEDKIFGLNAAKLFGVDVKASRNAIKVDKLAAFKAEYENAPQPANTQYGWVWQPERGKSRRRRSEAEVRRSEDRTQNAQRGHCASISPDTCIEFSSHIARASLRRMAKMSRPPTEIANCGKTSF